MADPLLTSDLRFGLVSRWKARPPARRVIDMAVAAAEKAAPDLLGSRSRGGYRRLRSFWLLATRTTWPYLFGSRVTPAEGGEQDDVSE